MKKVFLAGFFLLAVCLSFFVGSYSKEQEMNRQREKKCDTQLSFAIEKLKQIKEDKEDDQIMALSSNIYAAFTYAEQPELGDALHDLWNALLFDGKHLSGREEQLIKALEEKDAQEIKDIAIDMRNQE